MNNELGKYPEALTDFRETLKLNPDLKDELVQKIKELEEKIQSQNPNV